MQVSNPTTMASYHLSVKVVSRSTGRSATAAAAYRAAARVRDERTGELHDFARKRGVVHREIVTPDTAPDWAHNRERLWNAAEAAEKRRDAMTAREFEIALPSELNREQRKQLALAMAREIVTRHRCAVDVAIHAPSREGDERNHHAHLLCTTRRLARDGLAEKTRELDEKHSGEIARWRARWAELQNEALKARGLDSRVDHRSYRDQGRVEEPAAHKGPVVTAIERRGGWSYVLERQREEANERLARAAEAGRLERSATQGTTLDLTTDIRAAAREAWLQSRGATPVPRTTTPAPARTRDVDHDHHR